MRILAVDTTSAFGSIALWDDGAVLEEVPMHSPDGFSQMLFGSIEMLLARHGWRTADIERFAAASGPGSFTGVRVGLTAVKGLAEAFSRPAVAVSNLLALAALGSAAVRAAVADARRGEVYGAVYDANLQPVCAEVVARFVAWAESLPPDVGEIVCPDFSPFRHSFRREIPVTEQRALAASVARIAAQRSGADPAALDANYVRRADAELNWKDEAAVP